MTDGAYKARVGGHRLASAASRCCRFLRIFLVLLGIASDAGLLTARFFPQQVSDGGQRAGESGRLGGVGRLSRPGGSRGGIVQAGRSAQNSDQRERRLRIE